MLGDFLATLKGITFRVKVTAASFWVAFIKFGLLFACSQWPKDLVITSIVLVLLLNTLLIYFWAALLGYTSGVSF